MNELDAIQQQMADLGIDVSPAQETEMPMMDGAELSPEDEAMFQEGGMYYDAPIEEVTMEQPVATGIEEIQQVIAPMVQGMSKEQFADLVVWMASMQQPMM